MSRHLINAAAPHPMPSNVCAAEIRQDFPDARDLLLLGLTGSGVTPLLEATLAHRARPLLFAGAVRDAIVAVEYGTRSSTPRDFDIGLLGLTQETFDGLLRDFGAEPNRYGGYRLVPSAAPPIDVWRLEQTVGLRLHRAPCAIVNVLRSFVIDINALVFDPLSGLFHELGALDAIRARRISIVRNALLHSTATFAAKALLAATRLSFDMSPPLHRFVLDHENPSTTAYEASKVFGRTIRVEQPRSQYLSVVTRL
jgi:hypothetical protein